VFGLGGFDGEVAGEHARGDFAAVCAVADESAYQAGCFEWLRGEQLDWSEAAGFVQLCYLQREVALHRSSM
jgi:hypothetical protein